MVSSLYKYLPARVSFFDNYLIRATNKLGLNDPFEVNPSIDFFVSFCQVTNETRFGNTPEEIKRYLLSRPRNSNWRELGLTWYKDHGIVSLTETKDNLLMWSHYADEHRGLAVEFDITHEFFNTQYATDSNSHTGKVQRVLYRKERLRDVGDFFMEPYFHKSDEWAYEKEHRLLLPLLQAESRWISSDALKKHLDNNILQNVEASALNKDLSIIHSCNYAGSLIDISEVMFMFKVPKEAIKSITFGVNVISSVKDEIINKVREQELSIPIYQAELDDYDYRIKFEKEI